MMRNVTEYSWAPGGALQASRPWAALAAAATVLGASLSIAAPAATAGSSPNAVVSAAITGLDNAKPSLHFGIKTSHSLPITALIVALPSGLSVSSNASKLAHGVRATGTGKASSSVHKGQLIVSIKGNSPTVNLTVAGPALSESKALESSVEKLIAFNQAHASDPHTLALKLTITVDSGATTAIKVPDTIVFK